MRIPLCVVCGFYNDMYYHAGASALLCYHYMLARSISTWRSFRRAFSRTGVPFWKLVAKQFEDLLVIILLVAAVVSFILGLFDGDGSFLDAFLEPTGASYNSGEITKLLRELFVRMTEPRECFCVNCPIFSPELLAWQILLFTISGFYVNTQHQTCIKILDFSKNTFMSTGKSYFNTQLAYLLSSD